MLTDSETDNLLDTAAAARRCGYSYTTFIRLRNGSQTPPPDAWKGKRPLYLPATLDTWIAAHPKKTWRLRPPAEQVDGNVGGVVPELVESDSDEQAA